MKEGRLPPPWKEAKIVPIPKPKDPGKYRPISLLSCLSKVMERMVLNRVKWRATPQKENIFAYTEGKGTKDCLTEMMANINFSKAIAVFIDLEKAFELAGS